jgi:serine/threonine-protein kinase
MPLSIGDKLGPYEILAPLGAGGMGEVYKARDTKLDREVAIKVMPAALARDPERLARFEREAKALASLNHPNIATIYGMEESPEGKAIAMELVDGTTLHSPLPRDEALRIAIQIAEALEAAHEKGITHRDLKPANIMVTGAGSVKVLDFGLAAVGRTAAGQGEDSPTFTMAMTEVGMIMGTAAYMSPEQAAGKTVDRRADVWSFGVVLYEMLTGKRLFEGETVSHTLADVLRAPIDFSKVNAPTPIVELLKRCLDRDAKTRLRDIGEARIAIERYLASPEASVEKPVEVRRSVPLWSWAVMGVLALVTGLALRTTSGANRTAPVLNAVSLTMDLAPAEMLGPAVQSNRPSRTAFAISPDGTTVVFTGQHDRTVMLYRRPLAEANAVAIPGTEGAEYPFFSPDGQWVGFAARNKLRKVALGGGPPIDLCALTAEIDGASWGPKGVIAFAVFRSGLWIVPDSGGTPAALLTGPGLVSPLILPDGDTVLFTEHPPSDWEDAHVDSISLSSKQRKKVLTNAADARYSSTGHLAFMRSATLLAVPFDAARAAISGSPVPLVAGVMQAINAGNRGNETGMGQFALSNSGTLLYASGSIYPTRSSTLVRVDRQGKETALAAIRGRLFGVRVSPDGTRAVGFKAGDGSQAADLWLYELPGGISTRLTSTGNAAWPLFSADGKSILYTVGRGDFEAKIYSLPLNGGGKSSPLMEGVPASWSADGKWLAYLQVTAATESLLVRPIESTGEPRLFVSSPLVLDGYFSPDGHWIAYSSNESGTSEVYVQPFPGPGEKQRISLKGGLNPAWSRNGRELFYLQHVGADGVAFMAVDFSNSGASRIGAPRVLFQGPYESTNPMRSYDVTQDGQFLIPRLEGTDPDERVTKLNVVLGWAEELPRKVPAGK